MVITNIFPMKFKQIFMFNFCVENVVVDTSQKEFNFFFLEHCLNSGVRFSQEKILKKFSNIEKTGILLRIFWWFVYISFLYGYLSSTDTWGVWTRFYLCEEHSKKDHYCCWIKSWDRCWWIVWTTCPLYVFISGIIYSLLLFPVSLFV